MCPVHFEFHVLSVGHIEYLKWVDGTIIFSRTVDWFSYCPLSDDIQTHQEFSRRMLTSFGCGYCTAGLQSRRNLQYHLDHVKHHEVFACCHQFFRNQTDLEEHLRSNPHNHPNYARH